MQLDKTTVIENAQKYAALVGQQLNPYKIVLFGSFARGNATDNSDIDIAVIVEKINDDFLATSKMLNKLTRNIDNRIEPVLLENNDDRSGFLSTILLNGVTLFEHKAT